MRQELLSRLRQITPEERELLTDGGDIQRELYTSRLEFVIDSRKLLEKGRLIEIRPHTRFSMCCNTSRATIKTAAWRRYPPV